MPLILVARLLPTAVLAVAGWTMAAGSQADVRTTSDASTRLSVKKTAARLHEQPKTPCTTISRGTIGDLVPKAGAAGKELKTTDPAHRAGCSWNALEGYDYRWLDVGFEISAPADGPDKQSALQVARGVYADERQDAAVSDLGDEASAGTELTTDDGQQTREATVVVRKGNATVTVTYNGSDFEDQKAPSAETMREGALKAAREAVTALGNGGS